MLYLSDRPLIMVIIGSIIALYALGWNIDVDDYRAHARALLDEMENTRNAIHFFHDLDDNDKGEYMNVAASLRVPLHRFERRFKGTRFENYESYKALIAAGQSYISLADSWQSVDTTAMAGKIQDTWATAAAQAKRADDALYNRQ